MNPTTSDTFPIGGYGARAVEANRAELETLADRLVANPGDDRAAQRVHEIFTVYPLADREALSDAFYEMRRTRRAA